MSLLSTDVGRFRVVSILEGISYLLLLGVAMPLKYLAGEPRAVRVVGTVHGGLFVLFVIALALVTIRARWRWTRTAVAMIASLLPFGAFALERSLRRDGEPGSA
ncbi:MAG: DUF3817 domain-containing protein [Polyangiaceae bacterium]